MLQRQLHQQQMFKFYKLLQTAQVHQITLPIDTSEATGEVQIVGTTEGDPPVSYEFAEPKSINWNFPPDDDEEHLPDVKL